jgi:hypothetical protein
MKSYLSAMKNFIERYVHRVLQYFQTNLWSLPHLPMAQDENLTQLQ